jgi:putative alpha-1,2-mannosidase
MLVAYELSLMWLSMWESGLLQAMFSEGNLPGDAEFWRFNKIHEYGAYGEVNAHRYPSWLLHVMHRLSGCAVVAGSRGMLTILVNTVVADSRLQHHA